AAELAALTRERSFLRHVRHATSCGQSAAIRTGAAAPPARGVAGPARGRRHGAAGRGAVVVPLHGDGQNDPSYIPALIEALTAGAPRIGLVAGQRTGRRASAFKKLQSRVAN